MLKTIVTAIAQAASDAAAKQKVENQFAVAFNNPTSPTHQFVNGAVAPIVSSYYVNATKPQRDAQVTAVINQFWH